MQILDGSGVFRSIPGRMSFFALLTIAGLLLGSCGGEGPPDVTTTLRDSAGVVIVENRVTTLSDSRGWALSPQPVATIGSLDGPEAEQLFRVRGALRLPDGRIAVGNAGTHEVRLFGPGGRHLGSLGGEGEGPGEFSAVALVGLYGDTLVVLDRRLRRVSLLHPDEGFIRSFIPDEELGEYFMNGWLFSDGALLLQDLPLGEETLADGFHRDPVPLRTCNMNGSLLADLGSWPGAEQVNVIRETDHGIATVLLSVPFGKAPQVAVSGDHMYFSSQDSYEVGVYGMEGTLQRVVRMDRDPRPISERDLEAFIAEETGGLDEDEARDRRRELEEMPRLENHPVHGAIIADAEGYLFVEEHQPSGRDEREWTVFDPDGRWVGSLRLPQELQVLEIGEDYLLGLYDDELGVEYLHLYRLRRPGR